MTDLPPGWAHATTDALFTFVTSGSRGWARYYSDEGAPFIRIGNLRRGSIAPHFADLQRVSPPVGAEGVRTQVAPKDILISITADLGRIALMTDIKETTYINQHVALARPVKAINPRYVAWYLSSDLAQRQWGEQQRGVTRLGLGLDDIRSVKIPIPPLAEQGRIAAAIEEQFSRLDAGVAALERVRQNLKRMRAAVLEAAVTGRLTTHDPSEGSGTDLLEAILSARAKYLADYPYSGSRRRPSQPDKQALPPLASWWTWASVDQLSTRVTDGVHKKPNYVSEGIPFVTVRNLTAAPGISFGNLNYVTPEDHAQFCRRSDPEFGDLLVSKDGTLGVIRAVRDRRPFSIFVSVALIKPVLYDMTDYLEIALASPIVQRQMVPKGTGLQHIHLEDLRADCVPLPPLAEQKRIVTAVQSELSRLDHLESVIERQRVRAETLRSSILAAAFAGRLTPQDPGDEPASVLLARIAAERASSNGNSRARTGRPREKAVI